MKQFIQRYTKWVESSTKALVCSKTKDKTNLLVRIGSLVFERKTLLGCTQHVKVLQRVIYEMQHEYRKNKWLSKLQLECENWNKFFSYLSLCESADSSEVIDSLLANKITIDEAIDLV